MRKNSVYAVSVLVAVLLGVLMTLVLFNSTALSATGIDFNFCAGTIFGSLLVLAVRAFIGGVSEVWAFFDSSDR